MCIPIVGLLVALTATSTLHYYRFRHESIARQAASWAAAAQLQRYQAGAALDSDPLPGTLAPEIALKTTTTPGQGVWKGFQLVKVTATFTLGDQHTVREQISGYVRSEVQP